MNTPYPRTQPNIIGNFTHARCTRCHKQWHFDHPAGDYHVITRWFPNCITETLPAMGNRGAA